MTDTSKQVEIIPFDITKLEPYKEAKSKQLQLVKDNPLLIVEDNKTLVDAKKRRTALRQGRYELQKGKKLINSRLKEIKDYVDQETEILIGITLPAEQSQQEQVEIFEQQKQKEKEEAQRVERERLNKIRNEIASFRNESEQMITQSTLKSIDMVIAGLESKQIEADEFAEDFLLLKGQVIERAKQRKLQLEEAEKLRLEREKIEAERKAIEEERKAAEAARIAEQKRIDAERKVESDKLAKQRKEEQDKLDAERKEADEKRKAEEAKLKAEREQFEAYKRAEEAKKKAEKEAAEKEELKVREAAALTELKRRIKFMIDLGFTYDENNKLFEFGKVVIEEWKLDSESSPLLVPHTFTAFEEKMVHLRDQEAARIESVKPDQQKLLELVESIKMDAIPEFNLDEAKRVASSIKTSLEELKSSLTEKILEL